MNFCDFVGHEDGKLALILNAIDARCGGALFAGKKGSGKSTLARSFRDLLPGHTSFVEVPLNVTEDNLLGACDLERALLLGERVFETGILGRVDGGVLYVDDINLLPASMLSLIFTTQDRGAHGGFTAGCPARFIPVATMDPDGDPISSHFLDRFGMFVSWEATDTQEEKIEVARRSEPSLFPGHGNDNGMLEQLRRRIDEGRRRLSRILLPELIEEYIVNKCLDAASEGHRGEPFLLYASRAYAAFCGDGEVTTMHVDRVLPLVLAHRRKAPEELEEQTTDEEEKGVPEAADEPRRGEGENLSGKQADRMETCGDPQNDYQSAPDVQPREALRREELFGIGDPFAVRRITLKKDRLKRIAAGRRTKTAARGRSGRYVKSSFDNIDRDIAVDATLRAAAPLQKIRGRSKQVIVRPEDVRFKQREKKMAHLVIFLVDGSGSMGAQQRMIETKGAVRSLLLDCYQKRDKVSMIVFRRDSAEVVLPPTSSFELAVRRLKEMPVGGRTPLSAGLMEAYKLVKRTAIQRPHTRCLIVLVTDGRANQSLTDLPVAEELAVIGDLMAVLKNTDYIVVDTEEKKNLAKMNIALSVAKRLKGIYYQLTDLKSEHLTGMVHSVMDSAGSACRS